MRTVLQDSKLWSTSVKAIERTAKDGKTGYEGFDATAGPWANAVQQLPRQYMFLGELTSCFAASSNVSFGRRHEESYFVSC